MARKRSTDDEVEEKDDSAVAVEAEAEESEESKDEPLHLDVQVASPSACERHVTVTIAREDIERYFDDAFSEMMPTAAVPGFRAGRAPRKVVEHRFRDEVSDQVKALCSSIVWSKSVKSNVSRQSANPTSISKPSRCRKKAR